MLVTESYGINCIQKVIAEILRKYTTSIKALAKKVCLYKQPFCMQCMPIAHAKFKK